MRSLNNYSSLEWLKGHPVRDGFKQVRNDLLLNHYIKSGTGIHSIQHKKPNADSPIIISIAFNKPAIIQLLIEKFRINVSQAILLVADNSSDFKKRSAIEQICRKQNIAYLSLPPNKTRHANRSHGMAMQWCYERIIKTLQPEIFGFIDHDLIPLSHFDIRQKVGTKLQAFYGAKWISQKTSAWQLWAGYCFFHYPSTASRYKLNFLYDFSIGLDTGGRNYQALYKHFDITTYTLAADQFLTGKVDGIERQFHRIDQTWLHLGGAAHRTGFAKDWQNIDDTLNYLENKSLPTLEQHGFACTTRHVRKS